MTKLQQLDCWLKGKIRESEEMQEYFGVDSDTLDEEVIKESVYREVLSQLDTIESNE